MDSQIVKIENLNASNIIFNSPVEKPIPGTDNKQKYQEMTIEYNYGTQERPYRGSFYVECGEVVSSYGIVTTELNGRKKRSLQIALPLSSPASQAIVEGCERIYKTCANVIFNHKTILKLPYFNKDQPEASQFKNPIYFPRDKMTLEIIEGKSPNMYLTLAERGPNKTTFCDLNENILPWELLENVEMKMIPLIHFEKIYVGANKPSLQMKLISAVVTSVVSKGKLIRQRGTIESLKSTNPDLVNALGAQIQALKSQQPEPSISTIDEPEEEHETVVVKPMAPTPAAVVLPKMPTKKVPTTSTNIDAFLNS
jgi:hypothetical protein